MAKPSADKTISRRTLAKGAVWAVPAVAMTAAAPVYACSPLPDPPTGVTIEMFWKPFCDAWVRVTWEPVENATQYQVQYVEQQANGSCGAWSTASHSVAGDVTETEFDIQKHKVGYCARVRAFACGAWTDWSATATGDPVVNPNC